MALKLPHFHHPYHTPPHLDLCTYDMHMATCDMVTVIVMREVDFIKDFVVIVLLE